MFDKLKQYIHLRVRKPKNKNTQFKRTVFENDRQNKCS